MAKEAESNFNDYQASLTAMKRDLQLLEDKCVENDRKCQAWEKAYAHLRNQLKQNSNFLLKPSQTQSQRDIQHQSADDPSSISLNSHTNYNSRSILHPHNEYHSDTYDQTRMKKVRTDIYRNRYSINIPNYGDMENTVDKVREAISNNSSNQIYQRPCMKNKDHDGNFTIAHSSHNVVATPLSKYNEKINAINKGYGDKKKIQQRQQDNHHFLGNSGKSQHWEKRKQPRTKPQSTDKVSLKPVNNSSRYNTSSSVFEDKPVSNSNETYNDSDINWGNLNSLSSPSFFD